MLASELLEHISSNNETLAYIIRAELMFPATTFVTPPEFQQQVGFIVYAAGSEIARHEHLPLERRIVGTSEVLIVRQGRCQIDIYDNRRDLVATRELHRGDIVLMVNGGHGFRLLEDTVLLEIKQGPYVGLKEKEHF